MMLLRSLKQSKSNFPGSTFVCRRHFLATTTIGGFALAARFTSLANGSTSTCSQAEQICLLDGRQLAFQTYGTGDGMPVLYFHGTPSSRVEAELISDACIEAGVQLVAVDRPGIGLSSPSSKHSVHAWADDIRFLTDHLQPRFRGRKCGLLAYSGGTPFALSVAAQLPNRIAAVASIAPRAPGAPGVPWGVVDKDLFRAVRYPRLAAIAMNRYARRVRRSGYPLRRSPMNRLAVIDRHFIENNYHWVRSSFLEAVRQGPSGVLRDTLSMPWPWCIELGTISLPVAIWQGTCDLLAPVESSDFLRKQIPDCQVVYAAEGHVTLYKHYAFDAMKWLCDRI